VALAVGMGLVGAGWFALTRLVMGTAINDAIAEAVGVVLAVLVAVSTVGAVVSARNRTRPANPKPDSGGPRTPSP
jgi:hypothetical protein